MSSKLMRDHSSVVQTIKPLVAALPHSLRKGCAFPCGASMSSAAPQRQSLRHSRVNGKPQDFRKGWSEVAGAVPTVVLTFPVEISPLAVLDEVGPVERMQFGIVPEHVELYLSQRCATAHTSLQVAVVTSH